jgi:hypothetical protein
MERNYWLRVCPFCEQGRLFVFLDTDQDTLYLHCEECESGWRRPEDVDHPDRRFLTLDEDFDARLPTHEEIVARGWAAYPLHEIEE